MCTKEAKTIAYLQQRFPGVTIKNNKRVVDGCSKKRPDAFIDAGTHIVIVEVDEFEHEMYDASCEHARMWHLVQDCGMPVVFIRFNPDSTKGLSEHHLAVLASTVDEGIKNPPTSDNFVDIVYLYYKDKSCRRQPLFL